MGLYRDRYTGYRDENYVKKNTSPYGRTRPENRVFMRVENLKTLGEFVLQVLQSDVIIDDELKNLGSDCLKFIHQRLLDHENRKQLENITRTYDDKQLPRSNFDDNWGNR